jgi:hypothetical protein
MLTYALHIANAGNSEIILIFRYQKIDLRHSRVSGFRDSARVTPFPGP